MRKMYIKSVFFISIVAMLVKIQQKTS